MSSVYDVAPAVVPPPPKHPHVSLMPRAATSMIPIRNTTMSSADTAAAMRTVTPRISAMPRHSSSTGSP